MVTAACIAAATGACAGTEIESTSPVYAGTEGITTGEIDAACAAVCAPTTGTTSIVRMDLAGSVVARSRAMVSAAGRTLDGCTLKKLLGLR